MNQKATYRQLNKETFAEALKSKLIEEANEIDATDKESVINELADIYQVVEEMIKLYEISPEEVGKVKVAKYDKKGGFEGANFVETLELSDNDEWNDYYRKSPEVFKELGTKKQRLPHTELTVPEIEPGTYRHYKGDSYELIGAGLDTETLIPVVIYRPLYESPVSFWVRPFEIFFETVEVEGKAVKRFEKIDE